MLGLIASDHFFFFFKRKNEIYHFLNGIIYQKESRYFTSEEPSRSLPIYVITSSAWLIFLFSYFFTFVLFFLYFCIYYFDCQFFSLSYFCFDSLVCPPLSLSLPYPPPSLPPSTHLQATKQEPRTVAAPARMRPAASGSGGVCMGWAPLMGRIRITW